MTKKQCYFTERQARRIQTYADAYGISFAEALRRILDQLLFTNAAPTENQSRGSETKKVTNTDETQETKSFKELTPEEEDEVTKYVSVLQRKWKQMEEEKE